MPTVIHPPDSRPRNIKSHAKPKGESSPQGQFLTQATRPKSERKKQVPYLRQASSSPFLVGMPAL